MFGSEPTSTVEVWLLRANAFDYGIRGCGVDDAAKLPAGSSEKVAELFFAAFAATGENQHLEVEEFAGSEIVAGLNYSVDYEKFAAWMHAFAAGFEELDAQIVGPVVNDVFHDVRIGTRWDRGKHIAGREGTAIHHRLQRSDCRSFKNVNGKPGDHPLTDIFVHKARVYGQETDDLIRKLQNCAAVGN